MFEYKAVIGLEIHAQIKTKKKMFSPEAVTYGEAPNTYVSPTSLALPGTLPTVNKEAVNNAIRLGIACNSSIASSLVFCRKNYFYPDLSKGYQITQGNVPICSKGSILVKTEKTKTKEVFLQRIHLEEDTAKMIYNEALNETFLDFNRAGIPLIEIVTEPCIESSLEAYCFLYELRNIMRYLEVCNGNMQEGSLRCDVNISVKKTIDSKLGQRVEIKNLNSIKSVKLAIETEIERQTILLNENKPIKQETRFYDITTGKTFFLRKKENSTNYRYFQEPNLPIKTISKEYVNDIKKTLPILPNQLYEIFTKTFEISNKDATTILQTKEIALFLYEVCQTTKKYKTVTKLIIGPLKGILNEMNLSLNEISISKNQIIELANLIEENLISFSVASNRILPILLNDNTTNSLTIAKSLGVIQITDNDALIKEIELVFRDFPDKILAYKAGQLGIANMIIGEVMKRTKNRFSPKIVKEFIEKKLN